ncbi:hypothetical protein DPEC_G00244980 [Dallia pectoralis]|uniref:Uncharacterized protein n=1 Tax=Dallia pectoralis TaxID=75939 RepID=A0ACC2FVP0_DALPE|nr:hypothetical protein DPEC_G00244980 [Dallia pectoralis]
MRNLISFWILLAYVTQAVDSLRLEPRTITVLRGDSARLTCITTEQWKVMVWLLNGSSVLTISFRYGTLSNNPNMTAVNCSTNQLSCWEFLLSNVQRSHQGLVTCDLQNVNRETADLFVQEMGTVAITGGDQIAIKGEEVLFQCSAVGWYPEPSLKWLVNGIEVDQGQYSISTEQHVDVDVLYNLHSNLSSQAAASAHVKCLATVSALPTPQASSVRLTVVAEVGGECNSSTTLIAGTASVSTILLLMLLCFCVALGYRRRRRRAKSSKHTSRRTDELEREGSSVAETTQGMDNLGYTTEGHTDAGCSDLVVTRGEHCQTGSISAHKIPDVVSSSTISPNTCQSYTEHRRPDAMNVRRVTTV